MMTGWFRRARQTLSTVKNREEAQRQQRRAACAAYRTLGVLQLAAQLMLWVTLYAYDRLVQTTWQAALLLALPLAGLWALWRRGEVALATQNGSALDAAAAALPDAGRGGFDAHAGGATSAS